MVVWNKRVFDYIFFIAVITIFMVYSMLAMADEPPPGTYLQSCGGVSSIGSMVTAKQCQNRAGSYLYNQSFNFAGCQDDIRNIDGNITCSKGDRPPPRGSYLATCVQVAVKSDVLYAKCKPASGIDNTSNWQNTSINHYRSCGGDIVNQNGSLRC